nr:hypothetical protein BaRGS_019594 [Batillaria attramentaria]
MATLSWTLACDLTDGPENDTEVDGHSPFITFNGTQMMTLTCNASGNPALDYDWLGVESLPRPVSEEFEGTYRNAPLSMTKTGIQIDLRIKGTRNRKQDV